MNRILLCLALSLPLGACDVVASLIISYAPLPDIAPGKPSPAP